MHMFKTLLTTAFCLTALVSPVSAEYPDKPIRMVVGYAPDGAADKLVPHHRSAGSSFETSICD